MWYNNYIDIPYKDGGRDRSGLDCWGLVRLVYSDQYGIELPSFSSVYSTVKDTARTSELSAQYREQWDEITEPELGCLVLMRVLGTETHVGVYLGEDKFLHIRSGANSVVESIKSTTWQHRIVGYYKYTEKVGELVQVIAKPHPLRSEKITVPVLAGTKLDFLGEWIKAEYNVSDKLVQKSVFVVNGVAIAPEHWATTVLRETDSVEYRVVARDSDAFRLVAIFAVAIIAPQLAAYAEYAYMGTAGATIAGSAAVYTATYAATLIAGSALINAIAPIRPPAGPADPGTTTAQNIITGANNQGAPYASIPVVLGKMRVTPPLGAYNNVHTRANPNFRADDSEAVLTAGVAGADTFVDMLLIWGYGPVVVDAATLRVGQVPVYKDDGSLNYKGFDIVTLDWQTEPSAALKQHFDDIYGSDISQAFPNVQLTYSTLSDGTTKAQPPIGRTDYRITTGWTPAPRPTGEGPNDPAWVSHGFTQPSSEISVAIQFPQGLRATIIQGKRAGQNRAAPVVLHLQWAKIVPGQPSDWQDWGYYTVGGTVSSATYTEESGSYIGYGCWFDGSGDNWGQVCGETEIGTGGGSFIQNEILAGGPIKDAFTWTITLSRTKLVGNVVQELWSANDLIQVRVRRVSGDNTEPNGDYRYSHTAVLQSFTSKNTNTKPVVDPTGTKIARSALQIQATDQINGQIDGINAIVQSICPDWDVATQTWITRPTSNPASLYRYVLQHPANARPVPDTQFDLVQLQHWHEYCNQTRTVTYTDSASNSYTLTTTLQYNNILGNSPRAVLEVLRDICAAGRASPAMVDGKWSVVIDEPKATIVQHFTPHNSWGFEATKMLPKMPDGLKVQFNDRDNDYVQKEVLVTYANKTPSSASFLESIQLPGVTSTAEAIDHARWHLAQIKLRPEVYTINTDLEYIVCNRGDRVKVTHDVPLWGGGSGRIKNIIASGPTVYSTTVYGFLLDEEIYIDPAKSYNIRLRDNLTGSSALYAITSSFAVSTFARSNNIATIKFAAPHVLQAGYTADLTGVSVSGLPTSVTISAITYNSSTGLPDGIQFSNTGSNVSAYSITGSVKLTSNYYHSVQLSSTFITSVPDTLPQQLFLFGEVQKESQDLIVTKIEPTTNKTARLTLVDYGVSSAFNIFTQYNEIASTTTFVPNITQRYTDLTYLVGDYVPYVDISQVVSDETVIRRLSDGTYEYLIRVPFKNVEQDGITPIVLSNDVVYVEAQMLPANMPDTSGATIFRQDLTAGSIDLTGVTDGLEALSITPTTEGVYRFRLRYVTKSGKLGQWSSWYLHKVIGKRNPPADVTYPDGGYRIEAEKLILSWNANTEPDFAYYEIRTFNAGWGNDEYLFRGNVTELAVTPTGAGTTDTWYIKAADTVGNYSTNTAVISFNYPSVANISDIFEEYIDTSLTEATITLSWDPVLPTFSLNTYEIAYTDTSGQRNSPPTPDKNIIKYTTSPSIILPANWIGTQEFTVTVVDKLNQRSSGYSKQIVKLPPNPITSLKIQVIDNNILLFWSYGAKTSLPILHALLKRSTDGGVTWETIGSKSGGFTSFSELAAGFYTYGITVVDTDGWESEIVQQTVEVTQPPDYAFLGEYNSTFENYTIDTTTSTVSKVNAINYAGELIFGVNTTETWAQHFTNNSWSTPQNQVSAGYPYYLQPGTGTSSYTEEIDLGYTIAYSQLTLNITGNNLVGNSKLSYEIYTKENAGDSYVYTTGFATNIRYIKIVISCSAVTTGSLYRVTNINLKLSTKQKTEANSVLLSSGGIVNFNTQFIDVQSIILSPAGTTPITALYDYRDYTASGTYTLVGTSCTVGDLTQPHGLIAGQNVNLYFIGDVPSGIYTITEVLGEYSYRVSISGVSTQTYSWAQQTEVQPASLALGDTFGTSVAISGNGSTMVCSAPLQESLTGTANVGSIYVFTRVNDSWTEQAHIFASTPGADDQFGERVSISADGNTIAVTCSYDDNSIGTNAGSVYVFTRSGSTWTEQAILKANDGVPAGRFGNSVSLSSDGNILAVGSEWKNSIAGSVYIFTRSGTTWTQSTQLVGSDTVANDHFGNAVSISPDGTTLAVAARQDSISGLLNVGSVYIFTRSGSTWTEQAHLVASDGAANDYFGHTVSLTYNGNLVAIGAYQAEISGVFNSGAVYIFARSGTTWTQQAKLYASDYTVGSDDEFGYSVSLNADGTVLAVGAYLEDGTSGSQSGATYMFTRSGTTWTQQTKISYSNLDYGDRFGTSVALSQSGTTLAVGAHYSTIPGGTPYTDRYGSAYVYTYGNDVLSYSNSMRCYILNAQTGSPITTPTSISYQIKGY